MGKLTITKNYLTNNRCYKQGVKRTPIGIQIHTIGCAQGTAKAVADYWNDSTQNCCVTYICDSDTAGKVLQTLPEEYYSWADGGYGNRNLITIEVCESDFMHYISGSTYDITDKERFEADILRGYDTAVLLCADICRRYKWNPSDKLPSGLHVISSHNEGRIAGLSTAHIDPAHIWYSLGITMDTFRQAVENELKHPSESASTEPDVKYYRVRKTWTDEKSQLGAYEILENAKAACPYGYRVFNYNGTCVYVGKNVGNEGGTQASEFEGLSEGKSAAKILELIKKCDTSGIFPSVSAAQMILESGYVKTPLAKSANNCFGMKANLSSNSWESVWDGVSVINVSTWEVIDGKTVQIKADFRKYPCIEDSIKDHAAYLLGATNGSKRRYEGLLNASNYREAIRIIKDGGYATDPAYVDKICSIIQRFSLDIYDPVKEEKKEEFLYGVQVGHYKKEHNAKNKVEAVKALTGFSCSINEDADGYFVTCGRFKKESNAIARVSRLKTKYKLDSFVKKIPL